MKISANELMLVNKNLKLRGKCIYTGRCSMNKYVAYVSSYTQNEKYGISIYDVDMKKGRFTEKDRVEVSNSSYITISHNQKYLYSITDLGVESYQILPDGKLSKINRASINGMRGCYLSTDYEDKFLFVAGYHDGKITALKIKSNGGIGDITDEIYLKGMGTVSERNFRCVIPCIVDFAVDCNGSSRDKHERLKNSFCIIFA